MISFEIEAWDLTINSRLRILTLCFNFEDFKMHGFIRIYFVKSFPFVNLPEESQYIPQDIFFLKNVYYCFNETAEVIFNMLDYFTTFGR